MTVYKCVSCGASSLVRSNFRLTHHRTVFCRKIDCEAVRRLVDAEERRRLVAHPAPFGKTYEGAARRARRRWKLQQREGNAT